MLARIIVSLPPKIIISINCSVLRLINVFSVFPFSMQEPKRYNAPINSKRQPPARPPPSRAFRLLRQACPNSRFIRPILVLFECPTTVTDLTGNANFQEDYMSFLNFPPTRYEEAHIYPIYRHLSCIISSHLSLSDTALKQYMA